MKYIRITVLLMTLFLASFSQAQTEELDESDYDNTAASVFKVDENNNYANNLALREARRVGLGLGVGGSLGLYGLNIEINFEDQDGAVAGFGGGADYSTFNMGWKHTFPGDTMAPYTTLGYSRWYDSSGEGKYKDSAILDRVLSDKQKESGQFAADFLTASLGLQYTQLSGYMAGTALFAEIVLLGEVNNSVLVPTGTLGAAYYF